MINSKLLTDLIASLSKLKDIDLSNLKDSDLESVKRDHEIIKLSQKLTSEFQQDISPIQKKVNRKRVDLLKKKGRDPKNLTKAELVIKLDQLQNELEGVQKESQ
jgi:hypothetical protein